MLDDLIPLVTSDSVVIKADIEESEPNVFRNESAGRFFKKFKIPFIMMEFEEYLRTEARRNSTAEWVDGFFYSRNYVPYNAHNNQQLERNFLRWPYLIYWKKHDWYDMTWYTRYIIYDTRFTCNMIQWWHKSNVNVNYHCFKLCRPQSILSNMFVLLILVIRHCVRQILGIGFDNEAIYPYELTVISLTWLQSNLFKLPD